MRRAGESHYCDSEHYTCKHSRKRSFIKCQRQYKVLFLSTCQEVIIQLNGQEHLHQEDNNNNNEGRKKYALDTRSN